ncbi:MAG: hypothetical protein R3F23_02240 [Verrucomicrobiia bacterium]
MKTSSPEILLDGKIKPEAIEDVKKALIELEEAAVDYRFNAQEVQEATKQLHDAVFTSSGNQSQLHWLKVCIRLKEEWLKQQVKHLLMPTTLP